MLEHLLRDQIRRPPFLTRAPMLARAGWFFVSCWATTVGERCASSGCARVDYIVTCLIKASVSVSRSSSKNGYKTLRRDIGFENASHRVL